MKLLKEANSSLKSQVTRVILYGSQARGSSGKHSDVDLLIILKKLNPELNRSLSRLATEAMEKTDYEEELSLLRRTEKQWEKMKGSSFYESVLRDGVILWG
jgi:predicted nucleotidyltransferase